MAASCEHLVSADARKPTPSSPDGCEECLAEDRHDWTHLRICTECGHVGCCDSSPMRHATAHYHRTSHPVVRSFEPGESWQWCYVDERIG
ncbi:CPA1 family monovalent cation:H+ antiporter [Saccharopolyspora erythraea NRRL 2338]|uniref:Zinc finger, UBP-type n=2 Tax=Saccharopolyspora erythraea TaxID=1836 RepID=A4FL67_SACEN|nr:UBP-type zinc finger domain-containing protein [Saccharopolyspora erythraea]EQD83741.1 zinc finger, UBP-type [Saccharopolyspora erythraea D]PFG98432.1 CPA1 family monovalent cation:H+ antiporter [Saccharopolyspora erythraea NRRL 2338]QRK88498.1 UBP-type zinc finger domain-containing protein [Saccharopolyspora erythraea]CAM04792.1 zinc finger, UBP-type [Saccharopolyspora erythraea NRRL 2338]